MNKIHRIIWSRVRNAWVVAHEHANSAGRPAATRGSGILNRLLGILFGSLAVAGPGAFADPAVNALPTGAKVTSGIASITQNNNTLTINQNTDKLITNWQSFNIGKDAKVTFVQPSSTSVSLNNILGQSASQIFGSLTANGQVVLINAAGIVFGKGSQIDVGALIASTQSLSNTDFLAGNYRFSGTAGGAIDNQGLINIAKGGFVAFIAPTVSNNGTINAPQGTVVLAAASEV